MKFEVLINIIWICLFVLCGLISLAGAIIADAWWHCVTAAVCFVFAYVLYTDEGIQEYIRSIRKQ